MSENNEVPQENNETAPPADDAPAAQDSAPADETPPAVQTAVDEPAPAAASPAPGWFVLHTLSGNEDKVRMSLITNMTREGLIQNIHDVLIPVEEVMEVKRGQKRNKKRKLFPGYVFVRMTATEEVMKMIQRLPNLARFVGGEGGTGPVPVTESEISRIRVFMKETKERPKIIYEVGEVVRIINGPFMDFSGAIQEMDLDRGRLKIMVEIFGRSTPVDLDFDQVEKV